MSAALKKFMDLATPAQQARLAELADTSRSYLYQLASGHRVASAEMAIAIEQATKTIRRGALKLPLVLRTDLARACSTCVYAKRAQRA